MEFVLISEDFKRDSSNKKDMISTLYIRQQVYSFVQLSIKEYVIC